MSTGTIYIAGAGGHAREIYSYLPPAEQSRVTWLVDEIYVEDAKRKGFKVDVFSPKLEGQLVLGVGATAVKFALAEKVRQLEPTQVISETAFIGANCRLGAGVVVAPLSCLTLDVVLEEHVHINVAATLSHDCYVGAFSTISPGAHLGGNVKLGKGVFIGIGAVVKNGIHIADGTVVGAGSVITKDIVKPNTVVVGNKGRIIRINEGWLSEI